MNQIFDMKRAIMASKLSFNLNKKMLVIGLGGYLGLTFIITFFIAYYTEIQFVDKALNGFLFAAYAFMLFVGSIVLSGRAFQNLNSPERSIAQLMMPTSTFEKFILPLIYTSLGWLLLSFTVFGIFGFLTNELWDIAFNLQIETFNIFNFLPHTSTIRFVEALFFIHSIFFLGAVSFKKYPLAKTALATFIINMVFVIFTLVLIMVLFGSFEFYGETMESIYDIYLNDELIERFGKVMKNVFVYLAPGMLYLIAYFKLKEREV